MRNYKKCSILILLTLSLVCITAGCRKKTDESTTAETESAATANVTSTTAARETAAAASGYVDSNGSVLPLTIKYNTDAASSGKSSVNYPVLDDVSEAVNALIQKNAESIMTAYNPGDDDVLSLDCEVIALDRNRTTVIYQGTFTKGTDDPVNIFISNTIDLSKGSNITLSDLVDAATVAGYILSDDCYFTNLAGNLSSEARSSLMNQRTSLTLAQYNDLLKNADFPLNLNSSTYYPGTFSFEKDGVIYFTVPVSHELGDYAFITYTPETK